MQKDEKAYLDAASKTVLEQMEKHPGIPIPVDPEVADHMGAFVDDSMDFADAIESSEDLTKALDR